VEKCLKPEGEVILMECVILAAGEGKRMRPLTATRPKVMIPLANRPMADHLVCAVRDAGITDFVFVVGYREQEVRQYFGDGSDLGVSIRYVTQRHQRGTADALRAAEDQVSDFFLLLNGDMIIRSQDIAGIIRHKVPCMGIFHSDHPEDFGVVTLEGENVTGLQEKSDQPRSDLINAGVYFLSDEIFTTLKSVEASSRGEYELTDALAGMITESRLTGYLLSFWLDVGYPWDLLDANAAFLQELTPVSEGIIEEDVHLSGMVSTGSGTVIKSGTYIEGPCIIGEDCRIGPHAYIRGATAIGARCHIGHSTEIKNSVIMEDTKIPHFNYVGDSVIGRECNLGAGTKVANLRHDHRPVFVHGIDTRRVKMGAIIGDGVRLGINCSINVGSVIGSGAIIAPHSLVEGCINGKTRVR
jgi:bifunctional UDP-N-acetylglucosamine pyrophosphorylase/glucosamine-1-phosphate N-acetyltransferase